MMIDKSKTKYDLEDRTLNFGIRLMNILKILPLNQFNNRIIDQALRSGTSVGANYREANETVTRKDFKFRIRICKKEAKETMYWLNLISENNQFKSHEIKLLIAEAGELVKIFATILKNTECNKRFSA